MRSSTPGSEIESRGVGRLLAFTDAVVAIAITLIVLPLVDSARSMDAPSAIDFLTDNSLNLLAAGLSFVVIAAFWKDHHRLYRGVIGTTPALVNANLLWVAGIAFLPLPTVLIVDSDGSDAVASGLYIGTILVSQIAVRLQELVIVRKGLEAPDAGGLVRHPWAEWITVGLTVIALVVSVSVPTLGVWPLALILLSRPINWIVRRRS